MSNAEVPGDVVEHFNARAETYDKSSRWCTDPGLMSRVIEVTAPVATERMLDVACGTGLVSRAFRPRVASIVGVDLTRAMSDQATPWLDEFRLANAESLPFKSPEFEITICRQGVQFMDARRAAAEMVRVTTESGRVVLINLCAHDEEDMREYHEILRLRNPARKCFFVPDDLKSILMDAGCARVDLHRWISEEDVDAWSDNGAIVSASRCRIHELYEQASPRFKERHGVRLTDDGRVIDQMLFAIAVGYR